MIIPEANAKEKCANCHHYNHFHKDWLKKQDVKWRQEEVERWEKNPYRKKLNCKGTTNSGWKLGKTREGRRCTCKKFIPQDKDGKVIIEESKETQK